MGFITNIFTDIKRGKTEFWIFSFYNIGITFLLFIIFEYLFQPIMTNTIGYEFDLFRLNSIIFPVISIIGFVLGANAIHRNMDQQKILPNIKIMNGSMGNFYRRNILRILIEIAFQIVIAGVLVIVLSQVSLNYIFLGLYFAFIIFANIFFINLGMIASFFCRRKLLHIFGIGILIIVLFIGSGALIPFDSYYPLAVSQIIQYFPTAILLEGGVSILLVRPTGLWIPIVYFLALNTISTSFVVWMLNKVEK